ncbi:protein kinase C delta type-like [Dendropsophus ebraccatus]|uniref:protein kinase C delta type-like n=1 Tax=Dendropsophus ebraccatus TaxID=150705 RepID=UPI003831EB85
MSTAWRRLEDMASTGQDCEEKPRNEKRKRKEEREEKTQKRRRGAEESGLEDEEPAAPRPYPISRYNVHQVLGRGAFGKVVLASVPGRNIKMAVKIIDKKRNEEETIIRERQILLAAQDCPFICQLYAAQQSEERAYLIMEYLPGGSLEALVEMCGCLNIGNVRFYTAEMICGLQFLHGLNIVHEDLKPDNVMLDADGHIRIIDLGMAREGSNTAEDWWCLGFVMARMAGPQPQDDFSYFYFQQKTTDKPTSPTRADAEEKQLAQDLIWKLMCSDPEKRLDVARNIRGHPFFSIIGWEELENRRVRPPWKPYEAELQTPHLQWPEDTEPLHPMPAYNYMSPRWARWMRRSRL